MPDDPTIPPDLLGRYLAGEATAEEQAEVRRLLAARPDAARALARALAELDHEIGRPDAPDAAASWAAVRQRMREQDERAGRSSADFTAPGTSLAAAPPVRRAPTPARPPRLLVDGGRSRHWAWAVTIPAAIAAGVAAFLVADSRRPAAPLPPRVYETAAAQRAELLLADGSRVRLAPASRLRVAAEYGDERRDVWLDGEAFFDVVHDERRPFTVYSGNASARDLGTEFAVRAYEEDGAVQVVVREGAVALSGVGTLDAGDVGRLAADGTATVRSGADVDALLGWLDGRHAFDDAPLGQVLLTLERWYGVDVRLADSALASLPFTGTLGDVPPRAAIDLVAATLGLRVRREEGGVVRLERTPGRTPSGTRTPDRAHRAPSA